MTTASLASAAYSASRNLMAGPVAPTAGTAGTTLGNTGSTPGGSFASMLGDALSSVAEGGRTAEKQATLAASGKADLVDVVTAVAETETALQTLVAVRDRVISAYEEIMRMQI